MRIAVKAPQLTTSKQEMTREDAMSYAEDKIEDVLSIFDINPVTADVVMKTEGTPTDPVQKIDIKANLRGEIIVQSSHSRDIRRAIDRAADDLKRQVKKYKTKKIDHGRANAAKAKQQAMENALSENELFTEEEL